MANRLAHATSPYLNQHADNPIDWHVWGREAFEEAARRDVPVLVSIGYATCHWCHVMAHESFSDSELGALANESVVAIKVDREELPAVDGFYMDALLAMRGQGGWPLTVFTTPDSRPFFAGTYFPPQPRENMPSLSQVITTIARTWRDDRDRAQEIASQLAQNLIRLPDLSLGLPAEAPTPQIDDDTLTAAAENLLAAQDRRWGGFGQTPKFPPLLSIVHLLRRHARLGTAPEAADLDAVRRTFAGIASGGIRDHVDGGISRYSVDAQWHIPHFEKMLFDNAQYLRAAVDWLETERRWDPDSRCARLAHREATETAAFLLERMQLPDGGFASGLDADSVDDAGERTEGAYYLETANGVPAPFQPLGPVEAAHPDRPFAVGFPTVAEWVHGEVETADVAPWETPEALTAREEIAARRSQRPLPQRDDKLVTEWNALAITALARAGRVLDDDQLTSAARRAFDAVLAANRGAAESAVTGEETGTVSARQGDAPGAPDDADRQGHPGARVVRSSTNGVAGPGQATLADVAQLAIAAHAVGESETFDALLREALGFVIFPARQDGTEQPAGTHRWAGASLLDAHGDGIVPVRGSDPLDDSTPSGRAALIEALRLADETAGDAAAGDTADDAGHADDPEDLRQLRAVLLASVLPALQQATRSLGWVLAEAELDAAAPDAGLDAEQTV
jgi:uncharacterized protein YyaL (SSP411 family)